MWLQPSGLGPSRSTGNESRASRYRPEGDGLTTRDWLVHVGELLANAG